MCDVLCDCPTGKSLKTCPALAQKIFRFALTPNHPYNSRHPALTRGAYRDRHGRWVRGAVAAARRARKKFSQGGLLACERRLRADERRLKRTAKPCGSGTRCWCQAGGDVAGPTGLRRVFNPPATEARGIRLRGERGISRKTTAQGMPGCSVCTCMLVCVSSHLLHTRPRVQQAPGLPCALYFEEGQTKMQTSDDRRREIANVCTAVIASAAKQSTSPLAARWIASLRSQ